MAAIWILAVYAFEILKMSKMNHVCGAEAPGVTPPCHLEGVTNTEELFWEYKWLLSSKIGHTFKHAVINYLHNINFPRQTIIFL